MLVRVPKLGIGTKNIKPDTDAGHWQTVADLGEEIDIKIRCQYSLNVQKYPSIKDCLNYAKTRGFTHIYMPSGEHIIDAQPYESLNNGIVVYNGITLEGAGYDTVLKVNPASINQDNKAYVGLSVEEGACLKNFRLDGQKDLVDRTGKTLVISRGIRVKNEYVQNIIFDNLWVYDFIGIGQESFGIFLNNANKNIYFRNIKGFNIDGSGVSINGDYLNNKPSENIIVEDSEFYDNTWQGISVYGGKNVLLKRIKAHGNTINGLNFEWCSDVEVYDSEAYQNGSGLGTYGKASLKVYNLNLHNNGLNWRNAEITINPGKWWQGSPQPNANAGTVEFYDSTVMPSYGKKHLYIKEDDTVNIGNPEPDKIKIPNEWEVVCYDTNGQIKQGVLSYIERY